MIVLQSKTFGVLLPVRFVAMQATALFSSPLYCSCFPARGFRFHRPFGAVPPPPLRSWRRRFSVSSSSSGDRVVARPPSELRKRPIGGSNGAGDEKLRALRELFSKPDVGIDAYIIPSQDAHQSEFVAECFERRAYITGFTGSAGTAVVTKEKAALWTDGRYFLQAEQQLNHSWILMRSGNHGVPTTSEWLNDVLAPGCKIGIDPFLFSSTAAEELKEEIAKKDHQVVFLYDINLVDEIWGESRPKPPSNPTRVHDVEYAGVDALSKLSSLRSELMEAGCTAITISMLDEVAWLLNMRGSDVPHSPVFYAYLLVELSSAKLFIDNSKITKEVKDHLSKSGVDLRPYEAILPEIERDAAALAEFWAWMEEEISKKMPLTEVEVADKLLDF